MTSLLQPTAVIGVLLAVGGVLVLVSGQAELRRRWCVWVGAAAVVFTASHVDHGMIGLAVVLAVIGGAEFARMVEGSRVVRLACWAGVVSAVALAALPVGALAVVVSTSAVLFGWVVTRAGAVARVATGVALVGLPLAALAALPARWTVPAMVAVSIADVAAWVGGRTLARHRPFDRPLSVWSPAKTWGGAVAGTVAAAAVLAWFGQWWLVPMVPVAGILGDLRESRVKRQAGVKDAGAWLPGFGGLLDRIDSVLGALAGICLLVAVTARPWLAGWQIACAAVILATCITVSQAARIRKLGWRAAFAMTGGITVTGRLPQGGCVVVAPHASHADTPALLAALDAGHAPRVAAAADYWFGSRFRSVVCRTLVGGFAVRRTGGGSADLLAAADLLRRGQAVVVFPAGSRAAEDGTWHTGAFRLAAAAGVPVVPVIVTGTDLLLPRSGRLTRHHVTVSIGPALDATDVPDAARRAHQALADVDADSEVDADVDPRPPADRRAALGV